MATTVDYIEFVCEQIQGVGTMRYRKMFGEYMVYVNDKPILLVCDNTVFVKKLPELAEAMAGAEVGLPYEGGREHYILDIEDRERARIVIGILESTIQMPKPRNKIKFKDPLPSGFGTTDYSECIARLTDKDAVAACAYADQITAESRDSDCWYPYFHEFGLLLRHKNSLVRNRAIAILAANARWDTEGKLERFLDEFLAHITDEKPITASQCIKALAEIAVAKPNLVPRIRIALENADLSGYRDSMQPLILKDVVSALQELAALEKEI